MDDNERIRVLCSGKVTMDEAVEEWLFKKFGQEFSGRNHEYS